MNHYSKIYPQILIYYFKYLKNFLIFLNQSEMISNFSKGLSFLINHNSNYLWMTLDLLYFIHVLDH
jgi:hypothetical protein